MPIDRVKPNPTPAIRPVWEHQAEGALRDLYADYKRTFDVPWVGVVSMAYAAYPTFFATLFEGLRPVATSAAYRAAAERLRRATETRAAEFGPPPMAARLTALGYAPREVDDIRAAIEIFSHGNFAQLPFVAAGRALLEGGALGGGAASPAPRGAGQPRAQAPLTLIEPHHALGDVGRIYDDIRATLGLPFVNTDYRALARWPSYFDLAWGDLKSTLATPAYEAAARESHDALFSEVAALPNPTGLDAARVRAAAAADASIAEVLAVTKLFTWLLPGLTLNVAFWRAQLAT